MQKRFKPFKIELDEKVDRVGKYEQSVKTVLVILPTGWLLVIVCPMKAQRVKNMVYKFWFGIFVFKYNNNNNNSRNS